MKKKFTCPRCHRKFSHPISLEYHKKRGCKKKEKKEPKKEEMIDASITEEDVKDWP